MSKIDDYKKQIKDVSGSDTFCVPFERVEIHARVSWPQNTDRAVR